MNSFNHEKRRILIVDDEPGTVETMVEVLSDNKDYKIDSFTCPERAYRAAQNQTYDLVIFDQFMPKILGIDLYLKLYQEPEYPELLKRDRPEFLLISGQQLTEIETHQLRKDKHFSFMLLPFSMRDFVSTVERILTEPPWLPLNNSSLRRVRYAEYRSSLDIEYPNGEIAHMSNVSKLEVLDLLQKCSEIKTRVSDIKRWCSR